MGEAGLVLGIRIRVVEMVVMVMEVRLRHLVRQLASRERGLFQAGIHTGLVEGERIERGEHAHIGDDRSVISGMAVAGRRHIAYQGNVEIRPAVHYGFRIFGHAAVKFLDRSILREIDSIEVAGSDTATASYTVLLDYRHLPAPCIEMKTVIRTFLHTLSAASAFLLIYDRLAVAVLLFLSCTRAAAHADVLYSTSEARHFMPLEMRQGNEYVRVHDCTPDLRVLHIHPPATGTSISSVPFRPSAMMTGQPALKGVNPFSHAQ